MTQFTLRYFKFTDEPAWLTAARAAGFMGTDEEGNEILIQYTHDRAIDVIGTITEGGEWDDDSNELVAPTVLDGWHVNYLGALPSGWESYEVTPSTPHRVFA
tara:strand:- start:77 stop:382 length:306 start_codon:yes stop_codon:yes gene_type:complete